MCVCVHAGILGPRSDTLSSDVIVNSISRGEIEPSLSSCMCAVGGDAPPLPPLCCSELETLETQLDIVEEEVARYKKTARLWKARYKQERTAR